MLATTEGVRVFPLKAPHKVCVWVCLQEMFETTSSAWVLLPDVLAVYFNVGPQEMPVDALEATARPRDGDALKVLSPLWPPSTPESCLLRPGQLVLLEDCPFFLHPGDMDQLACISPLACL